MSLLLATGILAVGGLGLFMYKTGSDDKSYDEGSEDSMFDFDLRSYFGNSNDNEDDEEYKYDDEDEEPEVYEPPKRSRGSKTKSVRKVSGTKRRY
jgi:hypothetical protein